MAKQSFKILKRWLNVHLRCNSLTEWPVSPSAHVRFLTSGKGLVQSVPPTRMQSCKQGDVTTRSVLLLFPADMVLVKITPTWSDHAEVKLQLYKWLQHCTQKQAESCPPRGHAFKGSTDTEPHSCTLGKNIRFHARMERQMQMPESTSLPNIHSVFRAFPGVRPHSGQVWTLQLFKRRGCMQGIILTWRLDDKLLMCKSETHS